MAVMPSLKDLRDQLARAKYEGMSENPRIWCEDPQLADWIYAVLLLISGQLNLPMTRDCILHRAVIADWREYPRLRHELLELKRVSRLDFRSFIVDFNKVRNQAGS